MCLGWSIWGIIPNLAKRFSKKGNKDAFQDKQPLVTHYPSRYANMVDSFSIESLNRYPLDHHQQNSWKNINPNSSFVTKHQWRAVEVDKHGTNIYPKNVLNNGQLGTKDFANVQFDGGEMQYFSQHGSISPIGGSNCNDMPGIDLGAYYLNKQYLSPPLLPPYNKAGTTLGFERRSDREQQQTMIQKLSAMFSKIKEKHLYPERQISQYDTLEELVELNY
jgi:hypothetical protein